MILRRRGERLATVRVAQRMAWPRCAAQWENKGVANESGGGSARYFKDLDNHNKGVYTICLNEKRSNDCNSDELHFLKMFLMVHRLKG